MNSLKDLEASVKELAAWAGYGDNEVHGYTATTTASYEIIISTRLKLPHQLLMFGNKAIVDELVKQIQDPIKNSMLVENLTEELTKEVQTLKTQVAAYKNLYEAAAKYETYYNLYYRMEHGE